jgi:general secretion pathway protein A
VSAHHMTHISHFRLKEEPFSKEIGDAQLWLPPTKAPLVDDLESAVRARSSALLVGEPGVGKTCLLRALRRRLEHADFQLTYCHNTTLGRRDFYRQLCVALGLNPKATAASLFHAISSHVQNLATQRAHPVFVIDEAHLLHQDTLDHLHILLNYEWDRRALLSVILVGLPDLAERLGLNRNRALESRLALRRRIAPLSPEDSFVYLNFRTAAAGADRDLFARDAATYLHEHSQGVLRTLDRLATAALVEAATRNRDRVERDIVNIVITRDTHYRS